MNVLIKNDSIKGALAITPSNSVEVNNQYAHAFMVTGGGNVAFTFEDGTTLTLTFVANEIIKVQAKYVMSTGTTATGIIGLKLYD